jgi:preprotein translocase subunit YajC
MFTTAAYAADATGGGMAEVLASPLLPMVVVFVILYVFALRPQQKRQKQLQDMMAALRRGDTVVTVGGLVGRISKVLSDAEIQVELAEGVRVRMLKSSVTEVRTKGEPVKDVADDEGDADDAAALDGALAGAEGNVKPLPANTNKSPARQALQRKGRRR